MTNEQIRNLFLAVDTNDVDTLKAIFDSDIILVFGNQEPIQGLDAVLKAFSST
jgi:ketosteroid isomerase-like protein